ncbi:hypothetical protein GCM10009584_14320 [Ornithinimicrobium humiphilum]|uniref:Uncharacterized protein n=1 Tax=Ornithinimicrobium humiphilum TaxID=125288 RepID=A0A543KKB9_9MICO|nr:hypothetical protein [Ornithinimicrobium humiphilum]TQM95525.1 hypothetical protein FB476_0369 [Ornithinimicrobium humiphilum]
MAAEEAATATQIWGAIAPAVTFLGSVLGGGFVGKWLDNRREDRYRYAAIQREAASTFLADTVRLGHSITKRNKTLGGQGDKDEAKEKYQEAVRTVVFSLQQIRLLFDDSTFKAAEGLRDSYRRWASSSDTADKAGREAARQKWEGEIEDLREAFAKEARSVIGLKNTKPKSPRWLWVVLL